VSPQQNAAVAAQTQNHEWQRQFNELGSRAVQRAVIMNAGLAREGRGVVVEQNRGILQNPRECGGILLWECNNSALTMVRSIMSRPIGMHESMKGLLLG
jgi:hypothetical protein